MFWCPEETLRKIQPREFGHLDIVRPQYIILEEMGNLPYGPVIGGEIKYMKVLLEK